MSAQATTEAADAPFMTKWRGAPDDQWVWAIQPKNDQRFPPPADRIVFTGPVGLQFTTHPGHSEDAG